MSHMVCNWNKHQWEQYGSKYCIRATEVPEPEPRCNYEDPIHYYSEGNQGRASLLLDKANKIGVIQFRGTVTVNNAINDISLWDEKISGIFPASNFIEKKFKDMSIHAGFAAEYKGLQRKFNSPSLYNRIKQKYDYGWNFLIIGHSLGGALATLCAADILLNLTAVKANSIAIITYGSPRVGNIEFARWLDNVNFKINLRLAIEGDVIPTLPEQSFGAFVHHGNHIPIKFTNTGYERDLNTFFSREIVTLDSFKCLDNPITRYVTSTISYFGSWVSAFVQVVNRNFNALPIYRTFAPGGAHDANSYRNCKRLPEPSTNNYSPTYTSSSYYSTNMDYQIRTILVECDIGWGNTLFIRGGAKNSLSWNTGLKMTCIGKQWKWETKHSSEMNFSFKVLINDKDWERGDDHPCNHNNDLRHREYRYQANFT